MKDKLQKLISEYGRIAFAVYLSIFALTMLGFGLAIAQGFEVDGVSSTAGTLGAAWVATKLTQPLRIGATLVLTPMVGAVINRRRSAE